MPYGARRLAAVLTLVVAVVVVAIVFVGSDGEARTIRLTVDRADHLEKGSVVRAAGQKIGSIKSAEPTKDGRANLVLSIDDDKAWPVPENATVRFRWASTIAFTDRYVDLNLAPPGGASAATIPDGGSLAAKNVTPTVEIDQVFNEFTGPVRQDLRKLIDVSAPAIDNAKVPFRRTLNHAGPALREADAVMRELGADPGRLDVLLRTTDGIVHSIRESNPGVGQLVSNAATTLTAINQRAVALQSVLSQMPGTLDRARTTLDRADGTLTRTEDVLKRLSPGVGELRRITPSLNRTLASLTTVGPDARRTLTTLRGAIPDLDPLLDTARDVMPQLASIGSQAVPQLNCIRPFSPELAGFLVNWTADARNGDKQEKYFHANTAVFGPPATSLPISSDQYLKLFPFGAKYAFPRPAGYNFGEPWFLPECHLGPETLDASKDPEAAK